MAGSARSIGVIPPAVATLHGDFMLDTFSQHLSLLSTADYATAVIGLLLLVAGQRLFWLGVGGLGFAAAVYLTRALFPQPSMEAQLVVGLVAGIAGIILALAVQKVAVRVAGFALGALTVILSLPWLWPEVGPWSIAAVVAGGILGLWVAKPVFDLALVVITACAGALLIAQASHLGPGKEPLLALVLSIVGLVAQLGRGNGKDD